MLTALLLLLGLSGAGAGLYTALREPTSKNPNKDSGSDRNISDSSGRNGSNSGNYEQSSKSNSQPNRNSNKDQPENLPLGNYGSSDSNESGSNERSRTSKPQVTHSADDIISKNSKYSHHRRPLLNAEALVEKENVSGALEIYQRTEARIPDEEIKKKLIQNIEDLKGYNQRQEAINNEDWDDDSASGQFPSGPIPLRDLAEAIREIAEALSESLQRGFYPPMPSGMASPPSMGGSQDPGDYLPGGQPSGGSPGQAISGTPIYIPYPTQPIAPQQPGSDTMSAGAQAPSFERQLPPGYFPAPIVYQVVGGSPSSPPSSIQQPSKPTSYADRNTGPESFAPSKESDEVEFIPPDTLTDDSPDGPMDLPEDTFFTREWDKFKDLPLVDRRSGLERRIRKDRRSGLNRKDRRSGDDRRKQDLFKEREEYLKRKAEEKKQQQNKKSPKPDGSLSDSLEPYYPPSPIPEDLPDINLPDPEEFTREDGKLFKLTPEAIELSTIDLPDPITQKIHDSIDESKLPDPSTGVLPTQNPGDEIQLPEPENFKTTPDSPVSNLDLPQAFDHEKPETKDELPQEIAGLPSIGLPDPEDFQLDGRTPDGMPRPMGEPDLDDVDSPDIEIVDGDLDEQLGELDPKEEEQEPEKILHGVLELKPPEVDDAPFLTLTYDFGKIPHGFRLSKNYSIMEYSYFKYKPMLMKAQEFARRKMLKNALNYYRVIKSQNIPPEMRKMINRNIRDITEFMEKFLMAKGG
ncbi:hypothetical protein [Leptospira sp. GIMC2001]|uniref:hypothetical protein n=1 Tax=Leptospira sp. GIMC2001 TaxID=1513297 RepID=UPI0023490F4E|nr:hypothetical protein [Leptospira sp. GIMC2001]WCL48168.1 hypothetical protein O4O04_12705 [Leptospira sp. GIMC2001]